MNRFTDKREERAREGRYIPPDLVDCTMECKHNHELIATYIGHVRLHGRERRAPGDGVELITRKNKFSVHERYIERKKWLT